MRDEELKRLIQGDTSPALPHSFYQRLLKQLSRPSNSDAHVATGGVLAKIGSLSLRDAAIGFLILLIGAIAWHQLVSHEDELHRIDTLSLSSLLTL